MPKLRNQGYYESLRKAVRALVPQGLTIREIAEELNRREIATATGKQWSYDNLKYVMARYLGVSTATYTRHLPSRQRMKNNNKENNANERNTPARSGS